MNKKSCCKCPSNKEIIYCGCECHKKIGNGVHYELVLASETFDDDNEGFEFGVEWYETQWDKENGFPIDVEWFKTEEERQKALRRGTND